MIITYYICLYSIVDYILLHFVKHIINHKIITKEPRRAAHIVYGPRLAGVQPGEHPVRGLARRLLSLYVYIYICIYLSIYIYIYMCFSLSLSISIYTLYIYAHIYIYIYIYIRSARTRPSSTGARRCARASTRA